MSEWFRRLRVAVVLLGLALGAAAVGASAGVSARSDEVPELPGAYLDPVADVEGGVPDVGPVIVTNDAAGKISLQIGFPWVPLPPPTGASSGEQILIFVWFDTDQNRGTGNSATNVTGAEYYAGYRYHTGNGYLYRWSGSSWTSLGLSIWSRPSDRTLRLDIDNSLLGNTQAFDFIIGAARFSEAGETLSSDFAPDRPDLGNRWSYSLTGLAPPAPPEEVVTPPPPAVVVKPVFGKVVTVPKTPVAGKRFTVTLAVKRSGTGKPLTTGKMTCDPSVKGKVVRHTESFKRGTARLTFLVPKTAQGKVLKVKVKIATGKQSALKVVTFKVR